MKGTVDRVMAEKNFGFIKGEDGESYFFHSTDFDGFWMDVVEDNENKRVIEVNFNPEKTAKGLRARSVNRLDWPNQGHDSTK